MQRAMRGDLDLLSCLVLQGGSSSALSDTHLLAPLPTEPLGAVVMGARVLSPDGGELEQTGVHYAGMLCTGYGHAGQRSNHGRYAGLPSWVRHEYWNRVPLPT